MTARGLRNFNPGNLDRNGTNWQGMAADQSTDPRFVVFTDAKYGIRALAKTLMSYQAKYGLNTVRKLIDRWAPPSENDTGAYVSAVAKDCQVSPDAVIDVDQIAVMLPLVKAIIRHENADCPYTDAELKEGLHLAGVSDAPAPSIAYQIAAAAPPEPPEPPPPVSANRGLLSRLWNRLA